LHHDRVKRLRARIATVLAAALAAVTAMPAGAADPRPNILLLLAEDLGARVGGGDWRLYTMSVPALPGTSIEARAVRYGWAESESVTLEVKP
jgi:hypothetical protein